MDSLIWFCCGVFDMDFLLVGGPMFCCGDGIFHAYTALFNVFVFFFQRLSSLVRSVAGNTQGPEIYLPRHA